MKTIRGTVKAESGRAAAGKWKRLAIGPGRVLSGLAGRSSATRPISVKVSAGTPNAAGNTVVAQTVADAVPAGIAETTWRATGEVPPLLFKVDKVVYDASYTGSLSGSVPGCVVSGSVTEHGVYSNAPFDGQRDRMEPRGDGGYDGGIGINNGPTAHRAGIMHGCDTSTMPPPPCDVPVSVDVPLVAGHLRDDARKDGAGDRVVGDRPAHRRGRTPGGRHVLHPAGRGHSGDGADDHGAARDVPRAGPHMLGDAAHQRQRRHDGVHDRAAGARDGRHHLPPGEPGRLAFTEQPLDPRE